MVKKKLMTVLVPDLCVQDLDKLVREGEYSSRADAIKEAIYRLVKKELPLAKKRREERKTWSKNYEL